MPRLSIQQWNDLVQKQGLAGAEALRRQYGIEVEGLPTAAPMANPTIAPSIPSGSPLQPPPSVPTTAPQGAPLVPMTPAIPMDDTEDEQAGGLGALSANAPAQTGAPAAGAMPTLQDVYAQQAALNKDILSTLSGIEKRRTDQYNAATEELKKRRFGPSKAEQLFALAAAIGKPTYDRRFGSVMANVTPALAEIAQANRTATEERSAAAQALRDKYLGGQEASQIAVLQERRKALEGNIDLAKAVNKPRVARPVGTQVVNGKLVAISQDPDTGAFTQTVLGDAPANLKPIPGVTSGQQPVFMGPNGPVDAQGNPVKEFDVKPKTVSDTEKRQIWESEDTVNTRIGTVSSLEQALSLNSQAYEGSLSGWRKTLGGIFSSDDPRYVATENFDNIVQSSGLRDLKTMFGANPTEGERKIYLELQAISNKPRAVREDILRRAIAAQKASIARETQRLERLKGGEYSTRGGSTAGKPSRPRIINWGQ